MKLTPEIKSYVRKLTKKYYKSLEIKSTVFPKFCFTIGEYNKIEGPEFNRLARIKDRYGLVTFNKHSCTMFINVRHHIDAAQIFDTVVHEMVHLKYPKLQHGKKFNKKIDDIVIGDTI